MSLGAARASCAFACGHVHITDIFERYAPRRPIGIGACCPRRRVSRVSSASAFFLPSLPFKSRSGPRTHQKRGIILRNLCFDQENHRSAPRCGPCRKPPAARYRKRSTCFSPTRTPSAASAPCFSRPHSAFPVPFRAPLQPPRRLNQPIPRRFSSSKSSTRTTPTPLRRASPIGARPATTMRSASAATRASPLQSKRKKPRIRTCSRSTQGTAGRAPCFSARAARPSSRAPGMPFPGTPRRSATTSSTLASMRSRASSTPLVRRRLRRTFVRSPARRSGSYRPKSSAQTGFSPTAASRSAFSAWRTAKPKPLPSRRNPLGIARLRAGRGSCFGRRSVAQAARRRHHHRAHARRL